MAAWLEVLFSALALFPPIRRLIWGCLMDVTVMPRSPSAPFIVQRAEKGITWAQVELELVNRNPGRKERIIGFRAMFKKRFLLWCRSAGMVPVYLHMDYDETAASVNIELEPTSPRLNLSLDVHGPTPKPYPSKRAKLFLILDMAGPMRRMERELKPLRFNP